MPDSILGRYVSVNYGTYMIELNGNVLPNASKEMIATTIIHEALHAYMDYSGINNYFNDHDSMGAAYVDEMANALKELFPTLSYSDATALAWGGLHESMAWSQLVMKKPSLAQSTLNNIKQYIDKTKGTGCQP
ncbi:hypothetical protein C3K47_17100 [Solitalea longa]|uniref:SprT-like domain-containing protein n=1 Tax=Solitalea longa TaxID=2079460 RepID=A0A2S4ZYQ1_9SPHI|nr:hypothetical protein [Solitalea longa]POY35117.1 hypothetical protein C3K47_17100 [Solitalea longa]